MNCCSLQPWDTQPWLLEAVSTLSQTFQSLPNHFCNITIIFWLQSTSAPQRGQGRQKPSNASQWALPPTDTHRAGLPDLYFATSDTAARTVIPYPSIVKHYVFFTKGWSREVPSPQAIVLTFSAKNRAFLHPQHSGSLRTSISHATWCIVHLKITGSLFCGSLTGGFPSQPEFKGRGNALLSSSADQAAGGAVDALTGFFPLARCWWGINRAENRDRGFPMQTMSE